MKRALVVSIHDVSPLTRSIVETMLEDLNGLGVEQTSLLVIPDHHRRAPLNEDDQFTQWLKERSLVGDEVVLHGYFHLRTPKSGDESMLTRWITRHYTAGEGEFYDMDFSAAKAWLQKGRSLLREAGLSPEGFIAPAWLLGSEAERAVREEGFAYTVRLREVLGLASNRRWVSQSLVYSVRSRWRLETSLLWNALLFRTLRSNPLMRASLHPVDWEKPRVREQILGYLSEALHDRQPLTYAQWVARG